MSSIFPTDHLQPSCKSIEIGDEDIKKVILKHSETNSGITFKGDANISIENSNEVVIGTLTQFMGPVTIMQQNSLKKPLMNDEEHKTDIPSISNSVPTTYVEPPSNIPTTPETYCCKNKKSIACVVVLVIIPIIFIIMSLTLSSNVHFRKSKEKESFLTIQESNATSKNETLFRNSVKYVMISHSNGRQCKSEDECAYIVHYHHNFHSHSLRHGNPNFARNFFIGGNGYFYLDQGWNVKNNVSDNNIEVCFMGNYTHDILNQNMVDCYESLVKFGINLGIIQEDYILVAHNQTYNTSEGTGKNIYTEMTTWPHWKDGYFTDV